MKKLSLLDLLSDKKFKLNSCNIDLDWSSAEESETDNDMGKVIVKMNPNPQTVKGYLS